MKKYILVILSALFTSGFAFSQVNKTTKPAEDFVKISNEINEAGKVFYLVDMSYFPDSKQKTGFMEQVYGSDKVFAASALRENDTFLVCGFESVVAKNDALALLNEFREKSATIEVKASSIEKQKMK